MNDQRDAHRFKAAPGKLWTMCGSRGWHGIAMHVGEVDSRLFKHRTVAQYAATPAAARFTLPDVFNEDAAVDLRKLLTDIVLQLKQKRFDLLNIDGH